MPLLDSLQVPGWRKVTRLHLISFPWQPLMTMRTAKVCHPVRPLVRNSHLFRHLKVALHPRKTITFCSQGSNLLDELERIFAIKFSPLGVSAFPSLRCRLTVCQLFHTHCPKPSLCKSSVSLTRMKGKQDVYRGQCLGLDRWFSSPRADQNSLEGLWDTGGLGSMPRVVTQ